MVMTDNCLTHGLCYFNGKENPVSGVLEYDNNQINLSYVRKHFFMDQEEDNYSQVEFVTSEGEVLRLVNGLVIKQKSNSRNVTTYNVDFQYIMLDLHPEKDMRDSFSVIKFTCTYFKDIFSNSPFRFISHNRETFYKEIKADVNGTLGICLLNPKIEISDKITAHEKNQEGGNVLSYSYTPYIRVKFFEDFELNNLMSEVIRLKNLFSFLMDSKILVEELFISSGDKTYKIFWSNEKDVNISMKTYKLNSDVRPLVKKHFAEIVSNFYLQEELFDDLFDTYINNLYKPIYADDYLVSQIIILEGLYIRFKVGPKNVRLKNMLENIIEETYELESATFNSTIKIDDSIINFLKEFRHYHSHLYERHRKPATDLDLYELALTLKEIIHEFISSKLYYSNQSYKAKQYEFEQLPRKIEE